MSTKALLILVGIFVADVLEARCRPENRGRDCVEVFSTVSASRTEVTTAKIRDGSTFVQEINIHFADINFDQRLRVLTIRGEDSKALLWLTLDRDNQGDIWLGGWWRDRSNWRPIDLTYLGGVNDAVVFLERGGGDCDRTLPLPDRTQCLRSLRLATLNSLGSLNVQSFRLLPKKNSSTRLESIDFLAQPVPGEASGELVFGVYDHPLAAVDLNELR